ncbi:HAD family phosphatase [bacterium]|nr:HAD family phosphatase [bacterium]
MQLSTRPRLIALDLDGTVVDSRNKIPPATVRELAACHADGIRLAFLTGRRPKTAGKHLDVINLPALVATNSGCLVWHYPAWRSISRQFFPAELVQPVAQLLAPHSANFYVDSLTDGFEFFYLERQPTPALETYLEHWGFEARRIQDPVEMAGFNITQIAMPGDDATVHALRDRITGSYDGQLLAMAVKWPLIPTLCLEIFHPRANKGAALARIASELNLTRSQIVAVGDDTNDAAMLEWAGFGIAMPQANELTRASADHVLEGTGPEDLPGLLEKLRQLPAEAD